MPREFTRIEGACHCRNIRFVLLWPGSGSDILIRKCGCTFCRKRAGSWTSHRNAELVAEIADPAAVSKYRFGTKTADFYVCSVCGLVPFVLSDIGDRQYAVVNVNVFEDFDVSALPGSSTNFDGEDICSRLERRKRNWIPNVQVLETVA